VSDINVHFTNKKMTGYSEVK